MRMIEAFRETQLRIQERREVELEARNHELVEDNKAILAESESIVRNMIQMADDQAHTIETIFGSDVSKVFADQAKPFGFDFAAKTIAALASTTSSLSANVKKSTEMLTPIT